MKASDTRIDKTKWAELLILQLPEIHEGRRSWLLNHGNSEEAIAIRRNRTGRVTRIEASND